MRQGEPANQVAILLPTDDAWAGFSPSKVTVTGALQRLVTPALMSAILSAGYNVDYTDADAINKVGINHQILVVPPTDRIPIETLKKIHEFVAGGGKVIAVGHAPSLDPEGEAQAEITELSKRLFDSDRSTLVPDANRLAEALRLAASPDLKLTNVEDSARNHLGFIRRKLAGTDIYFVVNTSNQSIDTVASFATAHKSAEAWNPDNATASPASANAEPIHLAPYESRIFVFSDSQPTTKSGSSEALFSPIADLNTDWKVTFTSTGRTENEHTLSDWIADPATLHYSGEAVYSRDFTVDSPRAGSVFLEVEGGKPLPGAPDSPPEHPVLGANWLPNPLITRPGPGMHAFFDPPIREAALVTINGQDAGALWHPPYRLEISKLLGPGQNHIEIHIYNTALNAWSAQPPHDYKPLIAKYGDRFQMQDLDKVMPISSGLLGKVQLMTQISK
jgi:hypothetical protein